MPFDLTAGQFMFVLRKRMKLPSEQAIFLSVDGTVPRSNALINELYHQHKDQDGFFKGFYIYIWHTRIKFIWKQASKKTVRLCGVLVERQ